jgi:undecaprenyl-phosphate 4-deoxy-4-formamido-L-arabinose transferase
MSSTPAGPATARPPRLSIVVPVFDEEANLPELLDRLGKVTAEMGGGHEIVLVNDGSRDRSWELLRAAAAERPDLVVVDLNRNYGQHAAVFAGFEVSRGEIVVTLDADLQNPPEEVPKLVAKMEEGYDLVGSVRMAREDTWFRRVASRLINRLTARAAGVRLTDIGCMLRAYRRDVVRHLVESGEISTFIPVLAELYAGRMTEIPVAHSERARGESKYSLLKLVRLQFDLVTSFSLLPLRVSMGIGVATSVLALVAAAVLIAGRLIYGREWAVSGVFTLFAVLFALLGVLLFAIGLLGEYVGRIYMEVRHRPRFVVREVIRGGERTPGGAGGA